MVTDTTPRSSAVYEFSSHEELIRMAARTASQEGLSLARFIELGSRGELQNPRLRDLWAMYGDILEPDFLGV